MTTNYFKDNILSTIDFNKYSYETLDKTTQEYIQSYAKIETIIAPNLEELITMVEFLYNNKYTDGVFKDDMNIIIFKDEIFDNTYLFNKLPIIINTALDNIFYSIKQTKRTHQNIYNYFVILYSKFFKLIMHEKHYYLAGTLYHKEQSIKDEITSYYEEWEKKIKIKEAINDYSFTKGGEYYIIKKLFYEPEPEQAASQGFHSLSLPPPPPPNIKKVIPKELTRWKKTQANRKQERQKMQEMQENK